MEYLHTQRVPHARAHARACPPPACVHGITDLPLTQTHAHDAYIYDCCAGGELADAGAAGEGAGGADDGGGRRAAGGQQPSPAAVAAGA